LLLGKLRWLPPLLAKAVAKVSQTTGGGIEGVGHSLPWEATGDMEVRGTRKDGQTTPAKVGSKACTIGAANYGSNNVGKHPGKGS
jgi:hypothetical protein